MRLTPAMFLSLKIMECKFLSVFPAGPEVPEWRTKDADLWNPIGRQYSPGQPAMGLGAGKVSPQNRAVRFSRRHGSRFTLSRSKWTPRHRRGTAIPNAWAAAVPR